MKEQKFEVSIQGYWRDGFVTLSVNILGEIKVYKTRIADNIIAQYFDMSDNEKTDFYLEQKVIRFLTEKQIRDSLDIDHVYSFIREKRILD